MGRTANAVIALIECHDCHGYRAIGSCVCVKNIKDRNEKSTNLVAA
jgi:hypothetical protein